MKRVLLILAMAVLLFAPAHARQSGKGDAERLLKAAQNTELVDGNPQAAIKQYQAIVAKYGKTDRAVAASALIHLAKCYEKMGNAEARRTYEQVVKDYADQKEAVAEARARI